MAEIAEVWTNKFQQQIQPTLPDIVCNLNNLNSEKSKLSPPLTPVLPDNCNCQESNKLAVEVTNVCKAYGEAGPAKVLNNFSMKVPSGAIYSLLGSSGCGKTTILSCIVGLKIIDSGSISVLGHNQGGDGKEFLEIGRRIGYMPQELALYDHLTVKEILQYYGKLYDLTDADVDVRWKALAKLLDMSSKCFSQIKDLSGGQKRRVSLALALVHNPLLLILDEPTVGLDPLIRRSIWEHLQQLIATFKTTVLITTHYVEETKFSNTIGIMRNGRMLIEDSPKAILTSYKSDLLQDSILQICKEDNKMLKVHKAMTDSKPQNDDDYNEVVFQYRGKISPKSSIVLPHKKSNKDKVTFCGFKGKDPDEIVYGNSTFGSDNGKGNLLDLESHCHYDGTRCERWNNFIRKSIVRTISFSSVMWIYLMRQPIFAFILLFLPAVQLFMTFYVVGREPTDLKLGIINFEAMSLSTHLGEDICHNVSFVERFCDLNLLSCHIQNSLLKNKKLNLMQITKKDVADELLQNGAIFGYIMFPRNYSEHLVNRFMWGRFTSDNETFEQSKLSITLDKSHYLAYHVILKEVFDALESVSKTLEVVCGLDQHNYDIPLHYREPVFGKLDGTHQESIMPAIVAQILFEILYGIAPMILIKDLKQGTFARSNLAGLRFSEFMLGIFVTMGPILLLQSVSCYLVLQYGFNFEVKGSFFLFVLLCLMAGLCGQGFDIQKTIKGGLVITGTKNVHIFFASSSFLGIFVGIIVKSEFAVIVSAIMVVPIIMSCSGTLWPLESHPRYLMITYYIFPSALIVSSLRSVVNRGVGITHALVWPGLANSLSWSIVFWLLSIYGFRRMAKS